MISSLNDDWKPLLYYVGSLSFEIYYTRHEMTDYYIHRKSILNPVQLILAANIDRVNYIGFLEEILWNMSFMN